MADPVAMLFDEYAQRVARGERPDVREYLARAGEGAEELGTLIDRFLERVPPPAPDDASRTLAAAWLEGQTPLVELRARRGVNLDAVVDALISRLGLDRAKREKVERRYEELEHGLLDPRGVDRSVWGVLASLLRARAGDLAAWRPRPKPLTAGLAYRRADAMAAPLAAAMPRAMERDQGAVEEPDEIDRLFGVG
jgi:AcrR family transcriptional regulator